MMHHEHIHVCHWSYICIYIYIYIYIYWTFYVSCTNCPIYWTNWSKIKNHLSFRNGELHPLFVVGEVDAAECPIASSMTRVFAKLFLMLLVCSWIPKNIKTLKCSTLMYQKVHTQTYAKVSMVPCKGNMFVCVCMWTPSKNQTRYCFQ